MAVALSMSLIGRLSLQYLVNPSFIDFGVGLSLVIIAREVSTATSMLHIKLVFSFPGDWSYLDLLHWIQQLKGKTQGERFSLCWHIKFLFNDTKGYVYCPGSRTHCSKANQTICRKKQSKVALSATAPSTSFVISEFDEQRSPGIVVFPLWSITQYKLGFGMGVFKGEEMELNSL